MMRLVILVLGAAFMLASTAEEAPLPREKLGVVVAVGGGRLPDEVRAEFVRLAGGNRARLVVIPTASLAADDPAEHASFTRSWHQAGVQTVQLLHTRNRDVAESIDFIKPLREATGVWISGGDQRRLTATYRDTRVHSALREVLARGGVVGGTSAGAAVLGDPMIAGGRAVPNIEPGFGLIAGLIVDQHFTERSRQPRLTRAISDRPGVTGLGLDERTAAVIVGHRVRVLGAGTVTHIRGAAPADTTVHQPDSMLDLTPDAR